MDEKKGKKRKKKEKGSNTFLTFWFFTRKRGKAFKI